jgi:putative multiple sugar transport system permease protein
MAVLNNGLQLLGVGSDLVQIIKGMVLLAAVAVDVWNKSQGRPSIIGLLTRNRKITEPPQPPPAVVPGSGTPASTRPADNASN